MRGKGTSDRIHLKIFYVFTFMYNLTSKYVFMFSFIRRGKFSYLLCELDLFQLKIK